MIFFLKPRPRLPIPAPTGREAGRGSKIFRQSGRGGVGVRKKFENRGGAGAGSEKNSKIGAGRGRGPKNFQNVDH